METEIQRIVDFIREYMQEDEKVIIPVSGEIDSDVVARLCCRALGKDKIKCSMRSTIISCYQDKGYIIAGCTNRTEYELGFFVTFRR